jgi:hypothetical protein
LHRAAYRLFRSWTHGGKAFPGAELTVARQPDGSWKSSVRRLEPEGSSPRGPRGKAEEEQFWQAAVRAREEFFARHFGPLPGEIQKLVNLTGVWPGGGLYQMQASRLGGLGLCASWGLSNPDLPTTVRLTGPGWSASAGGVSFSGQLTAREPCWAPPDAAGYGYEVLVLTPAPTSWPLLTLSWLVQMELLEDADLLGRIADAQGVTLEEVKIGDGSQTADWLIEPACPPLPAEMRLPNGVARLLIATRITRDEMNFALAYGRPALLERLVQAGVGQVSILDRHSVIP